VDRRNKASASFTEVLVAVGFQPAGDGASLRSNSPVVAVSFAIYRERDFAMIAFAPVLFL
jgi:hypothetical protein